MRLDIQSSLLQELYDHWYGLADGAIPLDVMLDPAAFPNKLFPYISLFEVEYNPKRYYAKLVGNALVHHARVDYRHQYIDELSIYPLLNELVAWYDQNIDEQRASIRNLPFISMDDKELPSERLFLPFQNEDGIITKFIVATRIQSDIKGHPLP